MKTPRFFIFIRDTLQGFFRLSDSLPYGKRFLIQTTSQGNYGSGKAVRNGPLNTKWKSVLKAIYFKYIFSDGGLQARSIFIVELPKNCFYVKHRSFRSEKHIKKRLEENPEEFWSFYCIPQYSRSENITSKYIVRNGTNIFQAIFFTYLPYSTLMT